MNIGQRLLAASERHPEAEAVVDELERLTYADLLERATTIAGGLVNLGVSPGDRVATALRNRTETILLYWAAQWLGACLVPVNWRLRPEEVRYCVEDAGAVVLACEAASAGAARAVTSNTRVVAIGEEVDGVPFADLLGARPLPGPSGVDTTCPSLMLYTSGTTGRPKGVPRSHAAEWAATLAHVIQCRYGPAERTLGVMPLYHTMAVRSLLAMTAVGGCFVVRPEFRPPDALVAVEAERVSALYLAPTLFHDLLEAFPGSRADVSCVRNLAYAGGPMTAALVDRCAAAFDPVSFVNHYGSTEIYTFTVHSDQWAKPGCAGRAGINARIRLVPTGGAASPDQRVPPGEVGEVICHLSSEEAFAGYWNRPDADARALRDGWYFTGDLARLDDDGELWLVGRADDMVISGGENIHPTEVEEVLAGHPHVREVAVIGVADERLGQRVLACVVADGGISADELDAHCVASASLAAFKRPREYRFVAQLPRSPSGKLLRRLLRDE
ncbi:MAG: class I adenylate-forming enzyme family protein [Gaiellales bacterium]